MANAVLEKSYRLAVLIVKLCSGPFARRLSLARKQLFSAGTACGANVEESQAAESPHDFVHKIGIATKEAHETAYWLKLARDSGLVPESVVKEPLELAEECKRLGHAIIGSTRKRLNVTRVLSFLLFLGALFIGYSISIIKH